MISLRGSDDTFWVRCLNSLSLRRQELITLSRFHVPRLHCIYIIYTNGINITSLPLFANCSQLADTMCLPSTCTVLLHERSPSNKVYDFRTRSTQTLNKPDHGQRNHACSPSVSANFPISDAFASLPSKNRRLVQINIPFLHRVSITFVLRKLDRNPIFSERTRDTIM